MTAKVLFALQFRDTSRRETTQQKHTITLCIADTGAQRPTTAYDVSGFNEGSSHIQVTCDQIIAVADAAVAAVVAAAIAAAEAAAVAAASDAAARGL